MVQVLAAIHSHAQPGFRRYRPDVRPIHPQVSGPPARQGPHGDRSPEHHFDAPSDPFFGLRPLHSLKLEDGVAYIAHQQAETATDGTIRRECGVLLGLLNSLHHQ